MEEGAGTHLDGHIHGLWRRSGYTRGVWYHRELAGRSLTHHSGRLVHQNLMDRQVKQNNLSEFGMCTHIFTQTQATHFFWVGAAFFTKGFSFIKVELVAKKQKGMLLATNSKSRNNSGHFYMYSIDN